MSSIKIAGKNIENYKAPFIIAEAGINHNGEIDKALLMIALAKNAGADAIKFQTFKAEEFIADPKKQFTYFSQGKKITESMLEMFKRYEFSRYEWLKIKEKCDQVGIIFLSSPLNKTDLDLLLELNVPAIKLGSTDFTNIPFIETCMKTNLPIILSCGMSDLDEIKFTISKTKKVPDYPLILLLCTSEYPTPPEDVNLLKFQSLQKEKFDIPLGFSDHTQDSLASSLAVSFGACVFEKHFTLDRNLPGPDHWFSEDPMGLENWIKNIKKSYKMMGSASVRPTESEKEMKILARKSIVALKDIKKGQTIDLENLGLKRPGNGLPPKMLEEIIGKKAIKDLSKNQLLQLGDFE